METDLTKRWSGVVAATPDLADKLVSVLRDAYQADAPKRASNRRAGLRTVG
jgi:hypothetical protein